MNEILKRSAEEQSKKGKETIISQTPENLAQEAKNKGLKLIGDASKPFTTSEDEQAEAEAQKSKLGRVLNKIGREIAIDHPTNEKSPGLGTIKLSFENKFFKEFSLKDLAKMYANDPNPKMLFTLITKDWYYKAVYNTVLGAIEWTEDKV